jgi:hypothetical protein
MGERATTKRVCAATAAALAAALLLFLLAPAGSAEVAQKRGVRVAVSGKISPKKLPRRGSAPVSVSLGGRISPSASGDQPQLRRIAFEINSYGHLDVKGLPVCRLGHIQPSTNAEAMVACGRSLVGRGSFAADVTLPEQSPFPSRGKMLAFNGRLRGRPAIFAHIYGTDPAPTSYTLPFTIQKAHGDYGTLLEANLPHVVGEWGNITSMSMTLHRTFSSHGRTRSYLSASCPAPAGFSGASFPLARTTFDFDGGLALKITLNRNCKVRG